MRQLEGLLAALNSTKGITYLAIFIIAVLVLVLGATIFGISYTGLLHRIVNSVTRGIGHFISGRERKYYRDLTIGKVNEKRRRVKIYRFLNDLIIDLGLKRRGATPYEFLFLVVVGSIIISAVIGGMLSSKLMVILMLPIVFAAVMCCLYTKANLAHDTRIDAVIEAENIISNNIKGGVVLSVKNSLDLMPKEVRNEFKDFVDNVEQKNYHVVVALQELSNNLGTIADDFIKKCIMFETEEEHGYVGVFRDVVEVNNIKTSIRNDIKRKFEDVQQEFLFSIILIAVFLVGSMIIFDTLSWFYLQTLAGNIVIALDALLIVIYFVYITYLRAQEL